MPFSPRGALVALLLSLATLGSAQSAEKVLEDMLRAQTSVPRVLLVRVSNPGSSSQANVKIEVDRLGSTLTTVISPISRAGSKAFDDGEFLLRFDPRTEAITRQTSPRLFQLSVAEQMELIRRNYRVTTAGRTTVASRNAVVVTATPRDDRLPTHKLYVDREQDVLLRARTGVGSDETVTFDVLVASFGSSAPQTVYMRRFPGGDIREVWGPQELRRVSDGKSRVGFVPRVPAALPFGFVASSVQLTGKSESPVVAIRLTDGLVGLTVYQYMPHRYATSPVSIEASGIDRESVHYAWTGEVPKQIGERIVATFVSEANRLAGIPN